MSISDAIKIALISVSLVAVPAHAQELNDISTEVILFKNFNPYAIYGKTVKYYIAPGTRNVTFTVDDNQSYRVDIGAAFEEAMVEWRRAMGINFEPTSQADAQLLVYVRAGAVGPVDNNCGQVDTLGLTTYSSPVPSDSDVITISYFTSVIQNMLSDKSLRSKLKDPSDVNYVDMMIKYVSKHELGHALGFMHPRTVYTQMVPNCGRVFQSANTTSPYSTASIMTPSFRTYLNYLQASLYRPITIGDIDISTQERRAANRMRADACRPISGGSISKLDSGAKKIRCGSNPQIYPTLLFHGDDTDDDGE